LSERTNILILSDLHIDTWSDAKPISGKTKLEHFLDFLTAKAVTTRSLYIIGDLLDLPPDRGCDALPTQQKVVEQAIAALLDFCRNLEEVHYIVGNHDIGISGLRVNQDLSVPWLGRLHVTYPNMLAATVRGLVLIEHGHFYDPSLMIYAKDLLGATYYGSIREKQPSVTYACGLIRALQRRDPASGKPQAQPAQPLAVAEKGWFGRWIDRLSRRRSPMIEDFFKPLHWREAAREAQSKFSGDWRPYAIIFGHTHRPDQFDWDDGTRYFNCGDWAADTPHGSYLEIDSRGNIWDRDWIRDGV